MPTAQPTEIKGEETGRAMQIVRLQGQQLRSLAPRVFALGLWISTFTFNLIALWSQTLSG